MFILELYDGVVQLQIRIEDIDQLVPQRILGPLPVKRILLCIETLNLLQGLFQSALHGLCLLLVAADFLQVSKCLKLFELFLVALQLCLEPLTAKLYEKKNGDTVGLKNPVSSY